MNQSRSDLPVAPEQLPMLNRDISRWARGGKFLQVRRWIVTTEDKEAISKYIAERVRQTLLNPGQVIP